MNQNKLTKREILGWSMLACFFMTLGAIVIHALGFILGLAAIAGVGAGTWFLSKAINLTEGG